MAALDDADSTCWFAHVPGPVIDRANWPSSSPSLHPERTRLPDELVVFECTEDAQPGPLAREATGGYWPLHGGAQLGPGWPWGEPRTSHEIATAIGPACAQDACPVYSLNRQAPA